MQCGDRDRTTDNSASAEEPVTSRFTQHNPKMMRSLPPSDSSVARCSDFPDQSIRALQEARRLVPGATSQHVTAFHVSDSMPAGGVWIHLRVPRWCLRQASALLLQHHCLTERARPRQGTKFGACSCHIGACERLEHSPLTGESVPETAGLQKACAGASPLS